MTEESPDMEKMCSVKVLSDTFGIPPQIIRRMVHTGQLVAYRPLGGKMFIRLDDFQAAMRKASNESSAKGIEKNEDRVPNG